MKPKILLLSLVLSAASDGEWTASMFEGSGIPFTSEKIDERSSAWITFDGGEFRKVLPWVTKRVVTDKVMMPVPNIFPTADAISVIAFEERNF